MKRHEGSVEITARGLRRRWLWIGVAVTVLLVVAVWGVTTMAAALVDDPSPASVMAADPVFSCVNDLNTPNDVPGQKDLTRFCRENVLPNAMAYTVQWNWDEIQLSGKNTGDACGLFDTNGNGFADYALCVEWSKSQQFGFYQLYSCNDTSRSRCYGSAPISSLSSCGISNATDDPYNVDAAFPNDTKATCTVNLLDMAYTPPAFPEMLDACSYPSASPNSDPSDCIVRGAPGAALELYKELPIDDTSEWTLSWAGSTDPTLSSGSCTVKNNVACGPNVLVEGTYKVSEAAVSPADANNYTSKWACTDGSHGDGTYFTLSVNDGDIKTCTFTNTARGATITVNKVRIQDNGGTESCSDFSFKVDSGSSTSFESDCSNTVSVSPVAPHTVAEDARSGYTTQYSTDNVSYSDTPCSFTLGANGTAACYIKNDDVAPSLTLDKIVVNNNGGSQAESAWTLTADGPTPLSGPGAAGHTDVVSGATFSAGTYTLSESGPGGYTPSDWSCVKNSGATVTGNSITLGLGDVASCTITNDDKPATLTVTKNLIKDNGGTKTCADFSFTVNGGSAIPFEADCSNDLSVPAGTYNVVEVGVPISGYDTSYNNCSAVVLASDGKATCTITNDDKKATPSGGTVMSWVLHDVLNITGIRAGAPDAGTATVTFELFSNGTCSGSAAYTEVDSTIDSNGQAATTTGYKTSAPGTFSWQATYSGDQYNAGFMSACEVTTITAP
jgi:hypothetical protein